MADENYRRLGDADCCGSGHRKAASRYVKKTVYLSKACKQCGALMHGTAKQLNNRVFCSKQCNADDRKQHNVKTCEMCQAQFHRRRGGAQISRGVESRFCSNACKFIGQRVEEEEIARREALRQRDRALRTIASVIRRLQRQRERETPIVFTCVDCGCNFTPKKSERRGVCRACLDARARKLSRAIRARGKAIRRARLAIDSERFDPIEIFERDKWRCALCGVSTPRRLRGSNSDKAPELDHVIPLALGGCHTRANTQCACRRCNIEKGATPRGQLGLALG